MGEHHRTILRDAEAALSEGRPFRLTGLGDRQPLSGYRLELLCVGAHGAVWLFSRAQLRRFVRELRAALPDDDR